MKKDKILLMAAIATMAGLTSCSSDEDTFVLKTDTPMTVSAGVDNLITRSDETTTDITSGEFGLFLSTDGCEDGSTEGTTKETNYDKYNTKNLKFTYSSGWSIASDGQWENQPTTQLLWKSSESAVNYIAYMPFDKDMTLTSGKDGTEAAPESYSFSVKQIQSSEQPTYMTASDFLYYKNEAVTQPKSSTAIDITFKHIMSKLQIKLTKGTELASDFTISKVTLEGSISNNATINLKTGEVTAATRSDGDAIVLRDVSSSIDPDAETKPDFMYECILVPQTLQLVISINSGGDGTGGDTKTYTFTGSSTDGGDTFESGKQYTLELIIGRDKVEAKGFSITAWSPNTTDSETGAQTSDGSITTE